MMALLDKAVVEYVNAPGEVAVDNANGFVVVNVAAGGAKWSSPEPRLAWSWPRAPLGGSGGEGPVRRHREGGRRRRRLRRGRETVGTVAVSAAAIVEIAKSAKADAVEMTGADARLTVAGTVGSVAVRAPPTRR